MEPAAPPSSFDFFISYTGKDEAWAEWIAHHLRAHGYSFRFQKWHFNPGNFLGGRDAKGATAMRAHDRGVVPSLSGI